MTNAARRLYARDGTVILDVDDLVGWAVEHYMANMQSKGGKSLEAGRREPEGSQDNESEGTDDSRLQYSMYNIFTLGV